MFYLDNYFIIKNIKNNYFFFEIIQNKIAKDNNKVNIEIIKKVIIYGYICLDI